MVEGIFVEADLDACLYGLANVGGACPLNQLRIAVARHHEAHVDTCNGSCAHGEEHGVGGEKIGCLKINILAGFEQDAHIALHDVGPHGYRTARHDLCQTVVADGEGDGRIVGATVDECAVHKIPVDEERSLHGIDGAAPYAQVGVAPWLMPASRHITLGYVHAANERRRAVDDAQLAVVAIVDLARERRKPNGHEGMYVDARLAHVFKKL